MFHVNWIWWRDLQFKTPKDAILPFLATQIVITCGFCAFAAAGILAISIAAAEAPMSQRHAYLKD
jgi:hypothetical protein